MLFPLIRIVAIRVPNKGRPTANNEKGKESAYVYVLVHSHPPTYIIRKLYIQMNYKFVNMKDTIYLFFF